MRRSQWVAWTRTKLEPRERELLVASLTAEQSAHLRVHDWVWTERSGVLWIAPDGVLGRKRFTHGAHFETRRGEFYIDSAGSARARPYRDATRPARAA